MLIEKYNFKLGDIFKASVTNASDNGTVEIKYKGRNIPIKLETNSPIPKIGDKITLEVRQSENGLYLESITKNKSFYLKNLKSQLVGKKDFGKMTFDLMKNVFENPILKNSKIDYQVISKIKETLKIILENDVLSPNEVKIKDQVDRSGINYEGKIKRALSQGLSSKIRLNLNNDLKGQLIYFQKNLDNILVNKHKGFPKTSIKTFEYINSQIKLAVDNIEFQQLSNQFFRQEEQPILIQIPDPYFPENQTTKIYFKLNHEEEADEAKKGKKGFNLIFLLNMSSIGSLRLDVNQVDSCISIKIGVSEDKIDKFIQSNIPGLRERFQKIGYQVEAKCYLQKDNLMSIDNNFEEIIVRDKTPYIDIET